MTSDNELGNYIKSERGKHSIRKAASLANISHSYWSDLERGYSRATGKPVNPSADTMVKVAEALYRLNKDKVDSINAYIIDLFDLIGVFEGIESVNSFQNNEYTMIFSEDNGNSLSSELFTIPINDLKFHLSDDHLNTKFYNGMPLSQKDLDNIDSMIKFYIQSSIKIPSNIYDKIVSLIGKRSADDILEAYQILKIAFINKNQIQSLADFIHYTFVEELGIDNIDTDKALNIAESIFKNENNL